MIDPAALADLLGKWWFNYDEGNFDVLTGLLTEDVHFTCRTDTDTVAWAEFAKADIRGREPVMNWQTEHRRASPYPLRHNGANAHIVEQRGDAAEFASYIYVTHIVNESPAPVPGGIVHGVVRRDGGALRIAEMHVVLDTMTSDVFSNVRA
jgi:SnoaL-like protein